MITRQGREALGFEQLRLRREDLCMIRIESNFRDIIVKHRRFRKPITQRVCEVTAFVRFDQFPDADCIQISGAPVTFFESGDDLMINIPPVLLEIS